MEKERGWISGNRSRRWSTLSSAVVWGKSARTCSSPQVKGQLYTGASIWYAASTKRDTWHGWTESNTLTVKSQKAETGMIFLSSTDSNPEPSPPALCVWVDCSNCADLLVLLLSWNPTAYRAPAHWWQRWKAAQRRSGEAQRRCPGSSAPGGARCRAEETWMGLRRQRFIHVVYIQFLVLQTL